MAPIISRLLPASWSLPQQHGLQTPLQALISNSTSSNLAKQLTSAAAHGATAPDNASYRGGPQIAGIDLVAMLVSDSGLASTEPVWWNTSPIGCLLIGLQPRGGWQVLQRTVQWGQGRIARAFGVNCTQPALYAYFTCSIRNRLEVWESPRWESPMRDCGEGGGWAKTQQSTVSRPTKLIDGSRGGQAFMCDLLRPKDDEHYGIEQQARMQFLSVLLVAWGLLRDQSVDNIKRAFVEDFAITERLSVVFRRLVVGVAAVKILLLLALTAICYHFWHRPLLQGATPYVVEIGSIVSWAVGAVGLLIEGGNPRVKLIERAMAPHVEERYNDLLREA